jgi:hypothetical protein
VGDTPLRYLIEDDFYEGAGALRSAFEASVSDRSSPFDPARFVWEYWHVAGQFSQHRVPARQFFDRSLIEDFERRLLSWAGRELGLSQIGASPWLSFLLDGDFQALHRDTPNGQFAFSFGLSKPLRPRFRGGETKLARPELLDYWRHPSFRSHEAHTPLFDIVPARFNRLVMFDSRIPHAVQRVEGPRVPLDGRVAIQGWVRASGCVIEGAIARDAIEPLFDDGLAKITRAAVDGLVVIELQSHGRTKPRAPIVKLSTLVSTGRDDRTGRVIDDITTWAHGVTLPSGARRVIVPIHVDDRGARIAR